MVNAKMKNVKSGERDDDECETFPSDSEKYARASRYGKGGSMISRRRILEEYPGQARPIQDMRSRQEPSNLTFLASGSRLAHH